MLSIISENSLDCIFGLHCHNCSTWSNILFIVIDIIINNDASSSICIVGQISVTTETQLWPFTLAVVSAITAVVTAITAVVTAITALLNKQEICVSGNEHFDDRVNGLYEA